MKKTFTTFLIIITFVGLLCSSIYAQVQHQFWGMAFGGLNDNSIIFKTDPSGNNEMVKYNFTASGGADPYGSLMQASDHKLYGMSYYGGANNVGSLFVYDPATWTYTVKYDFYFEDGRYPEGSLIQASDGNLYGMSTEGGNSTTDDNGVIFKFNPETSTYTKLYDFDGAVHGLHPYGALLQASDGMLYGMTYAGGANDRGVLFQFDPSSKILGVKVNFDGVETGENPYGSLIQATDGKIYGMTKYGGLNGNGVLFRFDPSNGTYLKMLDFDGVTTGGDPDGSLVQAKDGMLYGLTESGGSQSQGVLFQFDPATSALVDKFDFDDSPNGSAPYGSLMQGSDRNLYGMTNMGGTVGGPTAQGIIFQYDPQTSVFTKKLDFNGTNGRNPQYTTLIEIPVIISTLPVNLTNCVGSTLSVPFSIEGAYDEGNVFTAQLSDASGSFASPVNIGSLTSPFAGSINVVIPANTPPGAGYRIRVTGTMPVVTGSDNGSDIAINALPNATTTLSERTITANQGSASYQWRNCTTGTLITGITTQSYTATANGSYAVIVTMIGNGCSDTSACVTISGIGINEIVNNNLISIYPNPASEYITISNPEKAIIEVLSVEGQLLKTINKGEKTVTIDLVNFSKGVYLIRAKTEKYITTRTFIKD